MPITVVEKAVSRPQWAGDQKSVDLLYAIRGTEDDAEALAALASEAPSAYGGLVRQSWGVEPVGCDLWDGTARYGPAKQSRLDDLEVGEVTLRTRSGGGSETVVVPLAAMSAYAPSGETAPAAELIGDDGHGNIAGVTVDAWRYEFEVRKVFESGAAAPTEVTLAGLANHVNDDTFSVTDSRTGRTVTAAAGECRFRGHEAGTAREDGAFEVLYQFEIIPNRAEFTIPGTTITVTGGKKGHTYLWTREEQVEDASAHRLRARIIGAYVAQVYPEGDFDGLDI